ncbi:MAG TPA: SRPBCC family protein [Gemmatimonadaceae bacterium]|nr:SRPBCC family protein [Gemmatimonadaceae bacterium]
MRYALIVLAILAAVAVVIVALGATLPVRHTASRQIRLQQPAEKVFALINDPPSFPTWRKSVSKVEMLPDQNGHRVFREDGKDGSILYEVDSVVPNQRLVSRIADKSLPFGGKWTYELSGDSGSTMLRITEDGEVYNPVFRFVSRFIMGHTATMDRYLSDIASHFREPGAVVSGTPRSE